MKTKILLLLISLLILSSKTIAISLDSKKKYPYTLLTNDYGVLNEQDLARYTRTMPPRPFTLENSGAYNYWQCFPRDKISVSLEDMGYSTEDYGWSDTLAELKIRVYVTSRIIHEYQMRAVWPVVDYEERFKLWHKLMAGQKYVCFAGSFGSKKEKIEDDIPRVIYEWTFEKIKTKKGSDSYLGS
jgi:hypothetical protein